MLIIDDGSNDATNEVAHELTRLFPQVRLFRHELPLGQEAAIRTGLAHSRGEMVVLRDGCQGSYRVIERQSPPPRASTSRPGQPNFLRRLKSFALGE